MLSEDEVVAALAAHGFGVERPATGAVVLASGDPLRVVWANPSATALFGTTDPDTLFAAVFAGQGRDGLAAAVRRLVPGGGARTERLRLHSGFRTRTLPVSLSRARLPDGEDLVVLAIPAGAGAQHLEPFAISALQIPAPVEAAPPPPAAPPPVPAAAPMADEVRRVAPAALAALGTRRFVWHSDAAGLVLAVSGAPAELDGLGAAEANGRSVLDLLGRDAGRRDALATLLDGHRPWSGFRLPWPLADETGAVPVTLGAVPIRGASGGFEGFRGFGVADFTTLVGSRPAPAAEAPASPPAGVSGQPIMAPSLDAAEAARARAAAIEDATAEPDATRSATPETEGPSLEPPRPEPPKAVAETRLPSRSSKVVALRPFQLQSGTAPPAPAGPADLAAPPMRRLNDVAPPANLDAPATDSAGTEPVNLSTAEHSNFHEIGRALKDGLGRGAGADARNLAPGETDAAAATLAAMPMALLVARDERILFANDALLALAGFASVEAMERAGGLAQLLSGLDPSDIAESREDRSFPIIDAAGQVLAVEGRAATVPWGGAPALALTLGPAGDRIAQTEGLAIELRRREGEAVETRALLDRVSDAVALVDGQGRVLMLNATGEGLFGRPASAVVGESLGTLLSNEAQSAALGAILQASAAGSDADPGPINVTGRRPGGGVLSLSMASRALGAGKVGVVLRDQSEAETLRRDVHRLRAELDHAAGTRSDVLARVSHEIRTPLNAILGFAEIILDERFGPIGNSRYRDYLTDIHAAGQHVIEFVGDLVDLSKMQAGRMDLSVAPVDVNRIVSETVGEMQGQAHRDRVIVRLSLLPHLPSAMVDEKALRQIMTNILSNGIAFNEPGGQVIVSTALTEADAVAVRVRDTGVGMSDAELATVMEPFREISMGRPATGSGLGLPLTRALVEANQATMSIRSRKNEGTLVEVVLRPAAAADRSVPAA